MGVQWTKEQQEVIRLRDRNILVSAAAGSGKTAVLVERILSKITDKEHPVDIDRLLIMTFTRAAAGEMKERISAAIEKALCEDPDNEHLQRQTTLLHTAQITTIDGFCAYIIRNYFHLIGLDPGYRTADEGELKLLRGDVVKALLEEYYAKKDEKFQKFVECFATGKSDENLGNLIQKLYEMAMSNPFPQEWLSGCMDDYRIDSLEELRETEWMRMLWDAVKDELDIPVLGVIEAGAKVAAKETRNKRVGVIGTLGTVGSGIHEAYLKQLDPEITVIGKACPLFVPLVEEGWLHDPVTTEIVSRYLQELKDKEIDTLILGCTHYPLIRSTIREVMGEGVRLVNPAYETALQLKALLAEMDISSSGTGEEDFPNRFYVSDLADEFKDFANSILPYDVSMAKKIDIEKY